MGGCVKVFFRILGIFLCLLCERRFNRPLRGVFLARLQGRPLAVRVFNGTFQNP